MEKNKKLCGNIKDFDLEQIKRIGKKVEKGTPIEEISKEFGLSRDKVITRIEYYLKNFDSYGNFKLLPEYYNKIGSKTQAYYTEKEMLEGFPDYTWKNLTEHEKQFYLNYEKKIKRTRRRKKYRRNGRTLE
jgi:hypothetical protein